MAKKREKKGSSVPVSIFSDRETKAHLDLDIRMPLLSIHCVLQVGIRSVV